MAAAVDARCSECRGRHTLCLHEGDFFLDGASYEYICPQTKRAVRLSSIELHQVVPMCPSWSIKIWRVDEPPAAESP